MQKIILYYCFTPLADPRAVCLWQRTLCEGLGLRGRIIISPHGINGTVGGGIDAVRAYVKQTRQYPAFKTIVFKWSDGLADDFPRLSVRVRDELVAFGAADQLQVDERGVVGGGTRLSPEMLHRLVDERGDDVVFFDGRNRHEASIGRFKNAVVPDVATSHDFLTELDDPKYDAIKNRPVVTYCTGGIRCEVLSALMKQRGFSDVYQLDGGIVGYGRRYKDSGLWQGSLYVFDGRMAQDFSPEAQPIGACSSCGAATSCFANCSDPACNRLQVVCEACGANDYSCSADCRKPEPMTL